MQIEGTKLVFIINFSVLDFFKFASRMPQIAYILVSTFNIFRTPLEMSSFFFSLAIPDSEVTLWTDNNDINSLAFVC